MPNISNETPNKQKRLGRGLGSLFNENITPTSPGQGNQPTSGTENSAAASQPATLAGASSTKSELKSEDAVPAEGRIWNMAVEKLKPSSLQPRTHFERDQLEELAQSIKSSGILQPIVARKIGSQGFEIVAGERRWRAAQLAGMHEVPVIIREYSDRETLELALVENLQRQDLNPVEEAEAFQRLASEFSLTQQQIAEKVGKERATITNALRLLQLPPEVRDMVARSEISVGHAKVLLSLSESSEQRKWATKTFKEGLAVRKLEKLLAREKEERDPTQEQTPEGNLAVKLASGLSDELQKLLGTKVSIEYEKGKGKMSIYFYSDEQLTSLAERVREGCQK
ncbi:MAG: chromosome partitioning protein [Bdellovibrio sp.]|nr:MAG: chromosome partitioning protein [Bdellovibrio sp.]